MIYYAQDMRQLMVRRIVCQLVADGESFTVSDVLRLQTGPHVYTHRPLHKTLMAWAVEDYLDATVVSKGKRGRMSTFSRGKRWDAFLRATEWSEQRARDGRLH